MKKNQIGLLRIFFLPMNVINDIKICFQDVEWQKLYKNSVSGVWEKADGEARLQENQEPANSGDCDKISSRLNYLEIQIEKNSKI